VPEWPNGAVSKTVVPLAGTVGSNPTPSARASDNLLCRMHFFRAAVPHPAFYPTFLSQCVSRSTRNSDFEQMKPSAKMHNFSFRYVVDETQEVARGYDVVCTPDFFGFNAALELKYRGRLDASPTTLVPDARREVFEAMCRIAETGKGTGGTAGEHALLDQVARLKKANDIKLLRRQD
jgi:hypothetical protein